MWIQTRNCSFLLLCNGGNGFFGQEYSLHHFRDKDCVAVASASTMRSIFLTKNEEANLFGAAWGVAVKGVGDMQRSPVFLLDRLHNEIDRSTRDPLLAVVYKKEVFFRTKIN